MSKPCSFFLAGYCRYGAACRFSHSAQANEFQSNSRSGMQGLRKSQASTNGHGNVRSSTPKGAPPAESPGRRQRHHQHRRGRSVTDKPPAYITRTWWTAPSPSAPGPRFRVMSYNVLADELACSHRHELYQSASSEVLSWARRWELIRQEVRHLQPDLVCFQEVDHWPEVDADMQKLGYEGCYAQRSGGRNDGCATFWHPRTFQLVVSDNVNFCDFDMRDNVGLLTLFLHKQQQQVGGSSTRQASAGVGQPDNSSKDASSGSTEQLSWPYLAVANTHILFNPKRGDVKVGQLRLLIKHLQQLVAAAVGPLPSSGAADDDDDDDDEDDSSCDVCCLVMGDMNHQPHTPIYQFMHQGWLDCLKHHRKHMGGSATEHNMLRKVNRSGSLSSSSYPYQQQQWAPTGVPLPHMQQQMMPHVQEQQRRPSRWEPLPPPLPPQQYGQGLRHCASAPVLTLRQLKFAGWEPEELVTATGGAEGTHLRHFIDKEQQQAQQAKQQRWQQKRLLRPQQQLQQHQDEAATSCPAAANAEQHMDTGSALGAEQQQRQQQQQQRLNAQRQVYSAAADLLLIDQLMEDDMINSPTFQQEQKQATDTIGLADMHTPLHQCTQQTSHLTAIAAVSKSPTHKPCVYDSVAVATATAEVQLASTYVGDDPPRAKKARSVGNSPKAHSSKASAQDNSRPMLQSASAPASGSHTQAQLSQGQQQQLQFPQQQEAQHEHQQRQQQHLLPPVLKSPGSRGWGRELWDEPLPAEFGDGIARHGLVLRSCYADVLGAEPEYTSCHDSFYGTVDYIWYTPVAGQCQLTPVAVLLPPAVEDHLLPAACLPSATVPSDHICLVCDFILRGKG